MSAEQDLLPEELLDDFFAEAHQMLAVLEKCVLALEGEPERRETLDEIFRAAHNLKSASATVKMAEIEMHAHLLEDVLAALRQSSRNAGRELIDALLEAVDVTRIMVAERSGGGIYGGDSSALHRRLRTLAPEPDERVPGNEAAGPGRRTPGEGGVPGAVSPRPARGGKPLYRVEVTFSADNPMQTVGGVQVYTVLNRVGRVVETEPDLEALCGDTFFERVVYSVESDRPESELAAACTLPEVTLNCEVSRRDTASPSGTPGQPPAGEMPAREPREGGGPAYQPPLRVDSRRVDDLLSLANEAVTVKASLARLSTQFEDTLETLRNAEAQYRQALRQLNRELPRCLEEYRRGGSASVLRERIRAQFDRIVDGFHVFQQTLGEKNGRFRQITLSLGRISEDLQESILRVRMVPLSQLFSRFPRLVRDLTRSANKRIRLITNGADTELDRSVLEDIQEPLVHCVRNAVDHGIEAPEERVLKGKDPEGTIVLRARAESREVVITVEDDGRGIDLERVRAKARERGLIAEDAELSREEIFDLIFTPGFSTADTVTRISGRGVGLDVIRRQVEQLRGTVSLRSETGAGTCFTLRLPLRLAVIRVLLARVGDEIYAVPADGVEESFSLRTTEIVTGGSRPGIFFQGVKIPLLRPVFPFKVDEGNYRAYNYVVVLKEGTRRGGLLVDSLLGEEDIIVRPVAAAEGTAAGSEGSAQLADGSSARVLDIHRLLDCGLS
jgi:two-component system chemotaxis sensor kinase CheA